ncbi:heme ABC transporter ATP-binding protein [Thiobaca trueperi]|uniref:Iron complex transport system ATP-binding protein n=1 Tax=Thiobaca trueperi TaxID=127458 RepID=A0A4R3MQK7_9GAMM|nr:heme ABC transporter ATP-binding protein [Thiobaca trueperi]TCT18099.1 iron complex transport system ATP-binding protein [Thiobaca trueperi]
MSLEAHGLRLIRNGRALIDGVSFSLHPGEVLVILGANGAGKSTLLRCLSGELTPDAGEIRLNGVPLGRWSAADCARRRATLPQQSPLSFPFTALEVAAMGRIPHGDPGASDTRIAVEALAAAEVAHLAERRYTTLSGGERQRVHLARILAQLWTPLPDDEPRYLLLDEPTASLDLAHQHATLDLARRWTDRRIGVLVVLHDLNLAAQYGDRIALMKAGRLLAVDRPQVVLEPANIEHVFGLPVRVIPHPELDCPLVIARQASAQGFRACR